MISDDYVEIWDTCCDHGYLGIALLKKNERGKIHFVDCVASIMQQLEKKFRGWDIIPSARIELHTLAAENISLAPEKSLICICGVGGETAIEIIQGLGRNHNMAMHDILICVQHHQHSLRQFLIEANYKSKGEILCKDGKWFYEIMLINSCSGGDIDLVGQAMFDLLNVDHQYYLSQQVKHFEKKVLHDKQYIEVLNCYKEIKSLTSE